MTSYSMTSIPILRDGVEVFIYPPQEKGCTVLFLFLASRRRLKIVCQRRYANLLEELAKNQPLQVSLANSGVVLDIKTKKFFEFLQREGIVVWGDPFDTNILPREYIEKYKRQLSFLLDITKSPEESLRIQKKIYDTHIALVGLGAVGCAFLVQLCMLGFRNFTLIDCAAIEENDVSRTLYHVDRQAGMLKTKAAEQLVHEFGFDPQTYLYNEVITVNTDIKKMLKGVSLIVNTADEPYIGYINIFLSRYAVRHNIPLLAGGGFDAHLGSLGELIVPFVTPCADCYATYFQESLKDWKPVAHPVQERRGWFGGLGSLSAFSAASGALTIFSFLLHEGRMTKQQGGRGEFLFHDYMLDSFIVERDAHCITCCGEKR